MLPTLKGNDSQAYSFSIYAHTDITDTIEEWEDGLNQLVQEDTSDLEKARAEHQSWWDAFWNRSWIFVSGDKDAETVTRGYLLQRYMQAIQGRGEYPIKFNGGAITFDYWGQNPDDRNWGAPYWFQNTRLLYWNMLASGDYEMMQPL